MQIEILTSAEQDLLDGFSFYELQQHGLGRYFLDSLFDDIDSLLLYAGIHPIYKPCFHRALAKRFPFAIYYTLENETITVIAVLDCRQNPASIKQRLV
jgi:plasmid stabilization system protein ParE